MYESRIYQPARAVWIFHHLVPSLVLKIVIIMCQVHTTFKAFDDSDRDLALFVERRVFPICDQFLVSCLRGIDPRITRPDIQRS
jgi:hypothetical protein